VIPRIGRPNSIAYGAGGLGGAAVADGTDGVTAGGVDVGLGLAEGCPPLVAYAAMPAATAITSVTGIHRRHCRGAPDGPPNSTMSLGGEFDASHPVWSFRPMKA